MKNDLKILKLKKAYEEIYWMAMRYANGRSTYAPSMVRDSIKMFQEVFPDWKPRYDPTLKSDRENGLKGVAELESDWLYDLVEESRDE